jgi:hypothetical protein
LNPKYFWLVLVLAMTGGAQTPATSEPPCVAGYHASGDTPFICLNSEHHKHHQHTAWCQAWLDDAASHRDFDSKCPAWTEDPTTGDWNMEYATLRVALDTVPIAPQKAPDPCDGVGCWNQTHGPPPNAHFTCAYGDCRVGDWTTPAKEAAKAFPNVGDYAGEPEQFTLLGSGNDKCSWDEECSQSKPGKAVPTGCDTEDDACVRRLLMTGGSAVPIDPHSDEGLYDPRSAYSFMKAPDGSKVIQLSDSEYSHLQQLRTAVVEEEKRLAVEYGADLGQGCGSGDGILACLSMPYRPADHYVFHGQFLWIERAK